MSNLNLKEQIKELDVVINQLVWELTDLTSQENKMNIEFLENGVGTNRLVRAQIRQKILDKKLEIRGKEAERNRIKAEQRNYVDSTKVFLEMLRTICTEEGHPEYIELARKRINSFKEFAGIERNESIPTAVFEEKFAKFA